MPPRDRVAPTLTISSDDYFLIAGETSQITFSFSEPPIGFSLSDIQVSGGSLSAFSGSGLVWTAIFTPLPNTANGSANIQVANGTFKDAAGNLGIGAKLAPITFDTLAPSLSISSDVNSLKAGQTSTITFSFSEDPGTSFSQQDIVVLGGTLSGLSGSGLIRTATFTPDSGVNNGSALISVANGSYTDAAGNLGTAATSATIMLDTAPPTLSISSQQTQLAAGQTSEISFVFSEAPLNFDLSDVSVSHGHLENLSVTADPKVYRATFYPEANVATANATIRVLAGSYSDALGNSGLAAGTDLQIDTLAPSLSISCDLPFLNANQTATVTFNFSEDPGTSFDLADVTISGGTLSNFSGFGLTRTATLQADANVAAGQINLSVAAGAYQDAAGNAGLAASMPQIVIDTVAPQLVISSNFTSLNGSQAALITFSFSESPLDFSLADIQVSHGYLSNLIATDNPAQFQATFQPEQNLQGVSAEIRVLNGSYMDALGNAGVGGITNIVIDSLAPSVSISSSKTALALNEFAQLTFTFSEAPLDFDISDLQVSNGFLIDMVALSDTVYTAKLIPQANLSDALIQLTLPHASYRDAAGNLGQASQMLPILANTQLPQQQLAELVANNQAFTINGISSYMGYSIAGAGDVNGDGLDDVILGVPGERVNGFYNAGASYVVFGQQGSYNVDLTQIQAGHGGFAIYGSGEFQEAGTQASGAGDLNGDGLDDLLVSTRQGQENYVIFGKRWAESVWLDQVTINQAGFQIYNTNQNNTSYQLVKAAGDVNGDGINDLLIGCTWASTGPSYVLFGNLAQQNNIDVANIQAGQALIIAGPNLYNHDIANAGDVNGDGLADIIVRTQEIESGIEKSYVVFGRTSSADMMIDLTQVEAGTGGFVIRGENTGYLMGDIASAGDVNGDGFADLIIGTPNPNGGIGTSFLVFGKADGSAVNLADIRAGSGSYPYTTPAGFMISNQSEQADSDLNGLSVSAAGDVNGDGLADLLIGAPASDVVGQTDAGAAYVVYGKTNWSAVNLNDIKAGIGGFSLFDGFAQNRLGFDVAAAGDVNGDGMADLMVSALGNGYSGQSYVVFGGSQRYPNISIEHQGSTGNDWLMGYETDETFVGGTGHDFIYAGGGVDVIYAGAGNDNIWLNLNNWQALNTGPSASGQYARIDGGSGVDTLTLEGNNTVFDLRTVANQGGGLHSLSRLESIEHIRLSGYENSLRISVDDIQDMNDFNQINALTTYEQGWRSGSYQLKYEENYHQLIVSGTQGNSLSLTNGYWQHQGNVYQSSTEYQVYTDEANHCQILIENSLQVDKPSNVVVFDLLQGVSSEHSDRTFDSNTAYAIYIRVSSESANLSTDGSAANPDASWGIWRGAENLSADDQIFLVGDGGQIVGINNLPYSHAIVRENAHVWISAGPGPVAFMVHDGSFHLHRNLQTDLTQIWQGIAPQSVQIGFMASMPAGLLATQGLI